MTATTRPLAPAPARRCCRVCWATLPTTAPQGHTLCLTCWRWMRLGLAIQSARRWMEARL